MKKSKTIFIIVLTVLLSVISFGIISFYDSVKESVSGKKDYDQTYVGETLECFTYAMACDLNSDFNIVNNDESLTDQQKQLLQKCLKESMREYKEWGYNDSYFIFSIRNTITNETRSNHLELLNDQSLDDSDNYRFYEHIVFDENGNVMQDGDLYDLFSNNILKSLYDNELYADDDYDDYDDYDTSVDISQVQTNQLKNLEITYIIPEKISHDVGFISSEFYSSQEFQFFSVVSLLIAIIIMTVFILFYPIRIVEEVNPFYTIKSWKAEILFIIFSCCITFGIMGSFAIVNFTLNDILLEVLQNYQISQTAIIISIINFVIWFATLFVITCVLFIIKYILVYGIWRYIKEKTILGSCCRYINDSLTKMTDIDLSDSFNKKIMQYILVNTGVIIVLIVFGEFGCFLAIVYAFVAFFFIKNRINEIQSDYAKLLESTNELSQGHFDIEINEDVGVFHDLKDQFNHIKIGFEKAVQEEMKSQNMKTELISNVSHDLKTPLTCIKNYIVLLQDDSLSSQTRHEYLNSLDQYSNRLTTLIEDLFEVSKVNSGNIQLDFVQLNIVALVEQALAESQDLLETRSLTVISHYTKEEILVRLDGSKTYRILENLFTNISKYAMAHSRVYIDIQDDSQHVILTFKNISQEQMNFTPDEIVERFIRGDKSRHETGSGLGLAIAKSFTEVQGGTFNIEIDGDLFKAILVFKKV